ncbi:hypothetical protein P4S72_14870 [Vibrio sp. PP-XX7]
MDWQYDHLAEGRSCLYGQALYWLGGLVCHAETKSISLTSPNACQFLLAGPKRNQKGLFGLLRLLSESVLFAILTHKILKNPSGIFLRSSVDFSSLDWVKVCGFDSPLSHPDAFHLPEVAEIQG